ncbi:hypothetical protein [Iningainema tapete]|nr:hypothetical protein [Iningainema tapete]
MKITTNQARMPKFAQRIAFIQQAKSHMPFLHMVDNTALIRLCFTLFLCIGLLSCNHLSWYGLNAIGVNITPIRELKPQQNSNTIYIQGKVEKLVPLVQRQAYQINDSTGKIWVVSNQNLKEGDHVVVKGKIRYQSIPLAGKEYGEMYLEE